MEKFCTACGARLLEVAAFCPKCGGHVRAGTPSLPATPESATSLPENLPFYRKNIPPWALGLLFVALLVFSALLPTISSIVSFPPSEQEQAEKAGWAELDRKYVESGDELLSRGVVSRFDLESRSAWVNHNFWVSGDASIKEGIAKLCANYVRVKSGDQSRQGGTRVTLYDAQTGQEIASYSSISGFRVE